MLAAALLLKDNVETPSPNTSPGVNNPVSQNIPVVTAPPPLPGGTFQRATPKKKTVFFLKVISFFLIPLVGAVVAFSLARINQDIRQQAGEGVYNTAVGATGTCTSLTCPSGYSVEQVPGATNVCQCTQTIATTATTAVDKCTTQQYLSCTRGCDPATGQCIQGKANGDQCSNNADCASLNCLTGPGGRWCAPTGTSIGKIPEGQPCATNAYDRECETGLVCQSNKCIKASEAKTTPTGSCLESGTSCEGGRGYADSTCGSNIRCGSKTSPTPTPTPTAKKANNDACTSNSECQSNNCLAGPGGKWCASVGTTIGKIPEGQSCATNAYDRECETGLVCQSNKCIKASEEKTTPVGNCLEEGTSCAGGRGYADSRCGGNNIRCGAPPTPAPVVGINATADAEARSCYNKGDGTGGDGFVVAITKGNTTTYTDEVCDPETTALAVTNSSNCPSGQTLVKDPGPNGGLRCVGPIEAFLVNLAPEDPTILFLAAAAPAVAPAAGAAGSEILSLTGGSLSQIPTATYVYGTTALTTAAQSAPTWLIPIVEAGVGGTGAYGIYQQGQTCAQDPSAAGCDLLFVGAQLGWFDDVAEALNSTTNRVTRTVTNQLDNLFTNSGVSQVWDDFVDESQRVYAFNRYLRPQEEATDLTGGINIAEMEITELPFSSGKPTSYTAPSSVYSSRGGTVQLGPPIGRGGIGTVYTSYSDEFGATVVKLAHPEVNFGNVSAADVVTAEHVFLAGANNRLTQMGYQEAANSIPSVYGMVSARAEVPLVGYQMELLEGVTLRRAQQLVGGGPVLSTAQANNLVTIGQQLDNANIFFSDIYPTNVLLQPNNSLILMDPVPNIPALNQVRHTLPGGIKYQVPHGNRDAIVKMLRYFNLVKQ